jgi:hypothetical protein
MLRGLHRLLVAAAEWRPRDLLIRAIGIELVMLFAVVSLGFATFAANTHLSALQGPVFAAAVISAAYGAVATIGGAALARWHARPSSNRPPAVVPPEDLAALLKSLAAGGTRQDQMALIAALQVGRALSPMELLAISLISGFFAGRTAGKQAL